ASSIDKPPLQPALKSFLRCRFVVEIGCTCVRFLVVFFLRDADEGCQRVGLVEGDDANTLRVAADRVEIAYGDPLNLATSGHHHDLIRVIYADDADPRAVALGGFDVSEALAAAVLGAVAEAARRLAFGFLVGGTPGRPGTRQIRVPCARGG